MTKNAPDGEDRQTDRQTHGHGDSMTESAQWGRFSEKCCGFEVGECKAKKLQQQHCGKQRFQDLNVLF